MRDFLRHPLARGTAWMSASYGIGLALQGVYFILLARLLEPDGLGAFAASLALIGVLVPFAGWGSGNLLVQRTARRPAAFRSELGAAYATIASTGLVLAALACGLALTVFHGSEVGRAILPLAVSELIFGRLVDLAGQAYQAHDRLGATALINVSAAVVRVASVGIYGLAVARPSAAGWSVYYACATVLTAGGVLFAVTRHLGGPRFDSRILYWREGFFFSLGSASKTVYADIDKIMLSRMKGDDIAGVYTASYRLVSFAFAPIQAFVFSSQTTLFRRGSEGAPRVWRLARRSLPLIWLYGLAVGAAIWLLAPLVTLVLGSEFESSISALRWLALLPLIQGTHYLFGDALMGVGRQAVRSGFQVGTAFINVGLNAALIPALSFRGAAIASLISEAVLAAALILWLRRLAVADTDGTLKIA